MVQLRTSEQNAGTGERCEERNDAEIPQLIGIQAHEARRAQQAAQREQNAERRQHAVRRNNDGTEVEEDWMHVREEYLLEAVD